MSRIKDYKCFLERTWRQSRKSNAKYEDPSPELLDQTKARTTRNITKEFVYIRVFPG
jgi:hypothetical protein